MSAVYAESMAATSIPVLVYLHVCTVTVLVFLTRLFVYLYILVYSVTQVTRRLHTLHLYMFMYTLCILI